MTLKELKEKLNQLPESCENMEVAFGEVAEGELLESIQQYGDQILFSCW